MRRTVVIEQPNYLPWIGYFDLIRQSDIWIWYDDVQYTKRDWRNRNRVAFGDAAEWLTIPVRTKGRFTQRICDVEVDHSRPWIRQHLETIRRCYARAPFFEPVFAVVKDAFDAGDTRLADLTIRLNEAICAHIGLHSTFVRSSHITTPVGRGARRLIDICRAVEGNVYLSGPAARAYIDSSEFAEAGIELRYVVYDYPRYERGGWPYLPNLSILDILAWLGPGGVTGYLDTHGHSSAEESA
jgi:hypothetical protein